MYGANVRRMVKSIKYGSLRETRRAADNAQEHAKTAELLVMEMLAQAGGEVTLTKGTIEQVVQNLPLLDFTIGPGVNENEIVVKLTTRSDIVEVHEGPDGYSEGEEAPSDSSNA